MIFSILFFWSILGFLFVCVCGAAGEPFMETFDSNTYFRAFFIILFGPFVWLVMLGFFIVFTCMFLFWHYQDFKQMVKLFQEQQKDIDKDRKS